MADGAPIYIRELTGKKRTVNLPLRALPAEMAIAAELRTTETQYPGSSRTSVQVHGLKEDDISLEFRLLDEWLGAAGAARAKLAELRGLLIGQAYCEFSWGQTTVRRGLVKRVEATYRRSAEIGVRFVFQVSEADESKLVVPTPFSPATTGDLAIDVTKLLNRVDVLNTIVNIINVAGAIL